jgi:multicomponent Na+:H+ antiporter subunit D
MWMAEIPVFVPFFVAAAVALVTRGPLRSVLMLAIIAVSGLHLWLVPAGIEVRVSFMEYELIPTGWMG